MEDDIIALISGLIDGRNDMLRRINRFNGRDMMMNAFLMNELRYLELINRVHQSHLRLTAASGLFAIGAASTFLDPVAVMPTSGQLQQSTVVVADPPANTVCAICQDMVTSNATQIRHCGHMYHGGCFNQWFSMSVRYPVCRHDVRTQPQADPAPQTVPDGE